MDPQIAQKIEAFFSQYKIRRYAKGQVLIHAQDDPSAVYHLVSGRVKQYDISYRGDEVVLNVFSPPAFFPMSFAINKTTNTYFFEADTDVELRLAPIEATLEFLKANPDVLYDLLARVYRGLDGLLGRLAHLMAASAKSRVLYELLIEARRFGTPHDGGGVAITIHESDIGARSGLARETVNREMQKIKQDGFLTITGREIIINDLDQLADSISHEL